MNIIEKALERKADKKQEGEQAGGGGTQQELGFKSVADDLLTRESAAVDALETQDSGVISGNSRVPHKQKGKTTSSPPKIDVKINFANLKDRGMLVPDVSQSQLAEEYRIIKRPIIDNINGQDTNGIKRANLVLVTSSLPGEGKTFTAANLALSIATERDKTVMLIDGDVAKPSISKLFGIESKKGLIDLVEGEVNFQDVVLRTDIPNLVIMPAGKMHEQSTEILASGAMKKLVSEISDRYKDRVIIIDSPPLLAATQGEVLASLVGQIVMVVESDRTPQHIVSEAMEKLSSCEVVGCVLNKSRKGFGMGYYYGYGNYAEE
ncbi:MAG: protein tyrosine kinase [Gammaproteobacteria bacterium]|nr:MAG: protein tyrosine kinase [Gammaproteobacteria bacterium]